MTARTSSWHAGGLLLLFAGLVLFPGPANSEESKNEKASPYAGFRSWKPINAEPKAVIGADLLDCRAPLPEERRNPHADGFINVYVSEAGRETYVKENAKAFAEGTVIVKEKLAKKASKDAMELGVMIKREKGFAPKSGDWQFIFVDAKGTVTDQQSKLENCASCHRLREKDDFVFRKATSKTAKDNAAPPPAGNRKANNTTPAPR